MSMLAVHRNKTAMAVLGFCLAAANAATVAILEIRSVNEDMDLTIDETKFLTDELRSQAVRLLPNDYSVLYVDKVISLIPEAEENPSVTDIGIATKSDYVMRGFIGKLGSSFTLSVELYETSSGNLLGDFLKESTGLKGLLNAIRENAPDLFAKIAKKDEPSKIEPPANVLAEPKTANDVPPPVAIPANVPAEPKKENSLWTAIGLDVFGAAMLGIGIYSNTKASGYLSEREIAKTQNEFKVKNAKAQDAQFSRNIFYIAGGALLLGGIAVHIWF